jgi:hypothetical protein
VEYVETSAKTGDQVETAFFTLINSVYEMFSNQLL